MGAWTHKNAWNAGFYTRYRQYVAQNAPSYKGTKHVDCADLSITLLIDFAAKNFLPVTFRDADGSLLCSKAQGTWRCSQSFPTKAELRGPLFVHPAVFLGVVRKQIQVKSLWYWNTVENPSNFGPGDLMMRYSSFAGVTTQDHAALVFAVYRPGTPHPRASDKTLKNFPGRDNAMQDFGGTEYFMGTPDVDNDWATSYKQPDIYWHFDYLNSRGDKKRNAELIYFANKNFFEADGFEFRQYAPRVLDNWDDWDGNGPPPRGIGVKSLGTTNETNAA
jgi:hypothetical protein